MVTPQDEFFHKRSDDPYWNESGWFGFNVPERELSGCVYIHHRPNRGYVWAGLIVWDALTDDIHNCLWHDFTTQHQPESAQVPEQSKVFEFETGSGLVARNPEPLKRYEFEYSNGACSAELAFEAFMEPHDSGLPEGWGEWGKGHYEQAGHVKGEITIEGERFEVDCLGGRDRSWGPHTIAGISRGGFTWGLASEDHGFLSQSTTAHPYESDPVIGTTEEIGAGWYRRGGVTATIVGGERAVTERDGAGRPVSVVIDGRDDQEREFHAEGKIVNALNFPMFGSTIFWHWCLTEWTLDGATAWGEEQDFFGGPLHRRFKRSLARKSAHAR